MKLSKALVEVNLFPVRGFEPSKNLVKVKLAFEEGLGMGFQMILKLRLQIVFEFLP